MRDCELHEVNISALLDGELEPGAVRPLLEHLMQCPRCRAFYDSARELEALAAEISSAPQEPAASALPRKAATSAAPAHGGGSPALETTERDRSSDRPAAGGEPRAWRRLFHAPAWTLAAAAVLLLAIGFTGGYWSQGLSALQAPPPGTPVEITLGENRGAMDQERFVALTIELLRADPSYHRELLHVLQQVQPTEQYDELVPLFASNTSAEDHVRHAAVEGPGERRWPPEAPRRGIE